LDLLKFTAVVLVNIKICCVLLL
jgi:glutathione S-transferase